MRTRHQIPLSGTYDGWTAIDFVMALDNGEVETRAIVLTPTGEIQTLSLVGTFGGNLLKAELLNPVEIS